MTMNILLTGAGSGIGRALAERIVTNFSTAHIIAVGRRLDPLMQLQNSYPDRVSVVQADVSKKEDRCGIVNFLIEKSKKVNFVIHNAGVADPVAKLEDLTLEEYRNQHAVNTEGPLFLTQSLIPDCLAKHCRFLFVSSGAAYEPLTGLASYCISKAGVEMVFQNYRNEYQNEDVFFASLRPGGVHTPMAEMLSKMPTDVFPAADKVASRLREKTFFTPNDSARFIENVLFRTTGGEYQRHWNINDPELENYDWQQDERNM